MKKVSQIQTYWPKIYQKLKSPPPGTNPFPNLPPFEKIVVDNAPSAALGHVTTEDVDGDGKLDVVHINSPRLAQELAKINFNINDLSKIDYMTPEELAPILATFAYVLGHEGGHLSDFNPESENPFPGGESVADTAARNTLQQMSIATNIDDKFEKFGRIKMEIELLKELNKLASELDDMDQTNLSDMVESIMSKIAQESFGDVDISGDVPEIDLSGTTFPERVISTSMLYSPGGLSDKEKLLTGQVEFDWGTYTGSKFANERYFILQGRRDLGSVQFKGDPFTYEPAARGKLRVVSGPESRRSSIGAVFKDPRATEEPAVARPTPQDHFSASPTPGQRYTFPEGGTKTHPDQWVSGLRVGLRSAVDYVNKNKGVVSGFGVMTPVLEVLSDETKSVNDYLEAWSEYKKVAPVILPKDVALAGDKMFEKAFDTYFDGMSDASKVQESQSSDMETLANDETKDIEKTASESKDAPSSEELSSLFWTGRSTGPFGRDRK